MFCIFLITNNLHAQLDTIPSKIDPIQASVDSIFFASDSIISIKDTLIFESDSLSTDTLQSSVSKKRMSPNALTSSVKYTCQDSIIINLPGKKVLLFEEAKAYYEDIELFSDFMEFGFVSSELFASGVADSCGHIQGSPIFKQGSTAFFSQDIRYNFKTQKAKVTKIITGEGEGYIHGYYVKHVDDKISYIKGGQYTTCNLEHPHFQIRFTKAKLIQNEKIITGPAYISFGNIPTPIAIPFGYFPIQKDRAWGIVMPTYGESSLRGFYFENFGYYFGFNDNFDLLLAADITTRGSWAAKAKANYVFRYKCNGIIEVSFAQNFIGERQTPGRYHTNDFRFAWNHSQDPKAHPTTRFNAHVNIISKTFNKYNPATTSDYLSNEFTSSLNFSTNANSILFFDAAIYYTQNTNTGAISISLPDINLSVVQFYPFRKKLKVGKLKWYDNISLKWSSQMSNRISTVDSLFLLPKTWEEIQSSIKHTIPLTVPIKLGKALNWNTNATFTETWLMQRNQQTFSTTMSEDSVLSGHVNNIFQRGFYPLHDLSLSTSLTTKLYITYSFKKGALNAIRHVLSPDLGFTYRPKLNGKTYGRYFNTLTGQEVEYAYYSGVGNSRTQAVARFTLNNNIEIKVKSNKDTIIGTRKISLFDNLSISCGYDFAADSMRWQPLTISGRTSLFSFLDITFGLSFDPYIISSEGRRVNKTELSVNKRPMRFSGSNLNIGVNWRINQDFFKGKRKSEKQSEQEPLETIFPENSMGIPNSRPDFRNPWNVTINYTFAYITSDNYAYYMLLSNKNYNSNIVQTINIRADLNITRKWKIGVTTGYDIQQKDFSYTEINIYRDLHCWEMQFGWVPFGGRKGWHFQINVKASVLRDLKFQMKQDFRDNYY